MEVSLYCCCSVINHVGLFATPWTATRQASSPPHPLSLLKLMSIESVMPSNHLILCCPLLLLSESFPASGYFPKSQLFTPGGQSIGASASVLPMDIQGWFPLELTDSISLQSKGLSRVLSRTTVQKHQFFGAQSFFVIQLSHPYMTTGKTTALTRWTFVRKVMALLYNMLSRFAIAFLPRSKHLSFTAAVIVCSRAQENEIYHCSHFFPLYICHEVMGAMPWSSFFECSVLSQLFHSLLSPSLRGSLFPLHFLPLECYYLHIWGFWYFSCHSWFQVMIHPARHFT